MDSLPRKGGEPVLELSRYGSARWVHVQGSGNQNPDPLWALTAGAGTVWQIVPPTSPGGSWGGWTCLGPSQSECAPVPSFADGGGNANLSIFDSKDTPWVTNGDQACGPDQNSHLYNWSSTNEIWEVQAGCLYNLTERDDDSLWAVAFNTQFGEADGSTLFQAPNRNARPLGWVSKGQVLSQGVVSSMVAVGDTVYFADGINLYAWSSSTGGAGPVVTGGVGSVARDQHSSNVYYTVFKGSTEQLWLY